MGNIESSEGWEHHLGDVNDRSIYQIDGGDATGSVDCGSSTYYVVSSVQEITYVVKAYGAAVSHHGGGAGGGIGAYGFNFTLNYTEGTVTAPQGFPGVVSESTPKVTINVTEEDEYPSGSKCAVPDIGMYGSGHPICAADADANQSHELPGSYYHTYICYESGCTASGFAWICYNTPCGHPWWDWGF